MIVLHPRYVLIGLACLVALASRPAPADETKSAAKVDPQARELLGEIDKAYKALGSYTDQGEFKLAFTLDGLAKNQYIPLRLALVRPNKLNFDAEVIRLVSDGKTMTTIVGPTKKYAEMPGPQTLNPETFKEGPVGAILFGNPVIGKPMGILLGLLVGPGPEKLISETGGDLRLGENLMIGNTSYPTLIFDQHEGADYRLVVDPKTKLLKRIDLILDEKSREELFPGGKKIAIQTIGWDSGNVATKEPARELFAFQPPKGLTKVESPEEIFKQPSSPIDDLVGKPAPDFALTVLDGESKTKTISKADLAGKVVMIDFWATWCGPCLMELPEVQKVVEAYKDKKDVLVVALSQDKAEAGDLPNVRKLVEKTLAEKKIVLASAPVGKIAIDPSGTIGEAFRVDSLPTVVLIDAQGVVQAARVGFKPSELSKVHEELSKDIDTLLAGKSLAKPKGEKAASSGTK